MTDAVDWLDQIDRNSVPCRVSLNAAGHQALIDEGYEHVRAAITQTLDGADWEFAAQSIWPRQSLEYPPIWSVQCEANQVDVLAWVGQDLHWLEGHFPEHPIVPGVALLHWVGLLCQRFFDCSMGCNELKRVKFQMPIEPEQLIRIELQNRIDDDSVAFAVGATGGQSKRYASGVLQYAPSQGART